MIRKMISGNLATKFTDFIFRIFEIALRILSLTVKLLKKIVGKLFSARVDTLLSRVGKVLAAKTSTVGSNSILFTTVQGEYTCNPKYIAEEILRRNLPYNITWVLRGQALGPYPDKFKLIKDRSPEYYSAVAESKVVIQNGHSLQKNGVVKNKGQYWLQTWHGSLGLKKLEGAGGDDKFYRKMQKLDKRQTDYVISNSGFEDMVYRSSYWSTVPILQLGHARTDVLFDTSSQTYTRLRRKVLTRLGIEDTGQRFLMFAPTHDDSNPYQAFGNLDLDNLKLTLKTKFGGDWEILIRTHNNNKRKSDKWLAGMPAYCHNASFYPDMQELMVVVDAGLTDYSSWIFDYILTKKPSFLFGTNIDSYEKSRGFYHKIEDTPFTIARNNEDLIHNISNFNQDDYEQKIDSFLKECKSIDDGMSAARIVDEVEKLMKR